MIVQITRLGLVSEASASEMEQARAEFRARSCLVLPQLLEPELVAAVQHRLDDDDFYIRSHPGIGVELCLAPGPLSGTLEFLSNDQRLFDFVEQLTGCGSIGCFQGRVYRLHPDAGHYDSWHSDLGENRLVAMSVNLGFEPYRGGALQIKDVSTGEALSEVANLGTGDAVVFRIAPHLRHRVTALEGTVPRTAYAGWFRSEPSYHDLLGARLGRAVISP